MSDEKFLDQEVRLRVLEKIAEKIDKRLDHLEDKMTNQALWTLGIMITLFGGVILHLAKLI